MPKDFHYQNTNPLYAIYVQICQDPLQGFTCRDLTQFLRKTLHTGQSVLQKQKIQALALHSFYKIDRNQDGRVTLDDLMVLQQNVRRMLAPTPSQDISTIRSAAQAKFQVVAVNDRVEQPIIQAYFHQRLPKVIPFRSLIAQVASLMLLEMTTDGPLPLRERHITEQQWIQTAIFLL